MIDFGFSIPEIILSAAAKLFISLIIAFFILILIFVLFLMNSVLLNKSNSGFHIEFEWNKKKKKCSIQYCNGFACNRPTNRQFFFGYTFIIVFEEFGFIIFSISSFVISNRKFLFLFFGYDG